MIRSAYVTQFVADLNASTKDAGTYIEPKYPRYVEFFIGVLVKALILLSNTNVAIKIL